MSMQTTICAPVTGEGKSAVAVVRLSGPQALAITRVLCPACQDWQPRRQNLCRIMDGEAVLDSALVTYFKAPHSFTGEDVVEFALHGSPYIRGRVLELLCRAGAVPARRGEYSYRAFLNGKMDLLEAQGLCDLISSGNKEAHAMAMSSLDGRLSKRLETVKKTLTNLLAQIEVRLDDVDEEMTPLDDTYVQGELAQCVAALARLADTFSVGKFIKEGLKVAIVGAPNAGKSSLLNALVGFDRAIVSAQSGTTRDTIEETLDINGRKIILTDTAGIRDHALDPAEQEGMKRSVKAMRAADAVIMVADSSRAPTPQEKALWADVLEEHKKTVLVLNKQDALLESNNAGAWNPGTGNFTTVKLSCKTGQGVEELKQALTQGLTTAVAEDGVMISNLRQYEAVLRAQTELEMAQRRLTAQAGGEIYAEHIRAALNGLKDLIGEVTPDDVLDVIFSTFCMGK